MIKRLRELFAVARRTEPGVRRHPRRFAQLNKALADYRYVQALILAHSTGLLGALAGDPAPPDSLAAQTGLQRAAVGSLLRILEAQGFAEQHDQRYTLSPFGREALRPGGSASVGHFLELLTLQAGAFEQARSGLRTGATPAVMDIYGQHSAGAFLDAVNGYLLWAGRALLARNDLGRPKRALVGSMGVGFSAALLEAYPDIEITYACLPHLVREIPRLRTQFDIPAAQVRGMHEHQGEPEDDDWGEETFDLVLLTRKMILKPEDRVGERFAAKALTVLAPGGVALLWEIVHPDDGPTPLPVALQAVYDVIASPAAEARTHRDYENLMHHLGYRRVTFERCLEETTFVLAWV